jgi:hypothetical protein
MAEFRPFGHCESLKLADLEKEKVLGVDAGQRQIMPLNKRKNTNRTTHILCVKFFVISLWGVLNRRAENGIRGKSMNREAGPDHAVRLGKGSKLP